MNTGVHNVHYTYNDKCSIYHYIPLYINTTLLTLLNIDKINLGFTYYSF